MRMTSLGPESQGQDEGAPALCGATFIHLLGLEESTCRERYKTRHHQTTPDLE